MRPLTSHFSVHALATVDTLRKPTKEARVLRRAQAVRAVVAGHHLATVSTTFHVAHSALRKWVPRFAQEGPPGLRERARSGRPPQITCALERHLPRLVDAAPLAHGALSSQWRCRALAPVFAREPGVQLGRERVRRV
jgi:transposase